MKKKVFLEFAGYYAIGAEIWPHPRDEGVFQGRLVAGDAEEVKAAMDRSKVVAADPFASGRMTDGVDITGTHEKVGRDGIVTGKSEEEVLSILRQILKIMKENS